MFCLLEQKEIMLLKLINLLDETTDKSPELTLGSFPEETSCVTTSHLYAVMLKVESKAATHNVSLIGHYTDSASNSFNALVKLY